MNYFQRSFAAGEISPDLYGRVDLTKYGTGLRTMRNFYVSRNGGAFNRPGTGYRATVQDSSNLVRLKNFTTANGYKYLLEFGNNYLRITDQGIPVVSAAVGISGYTANGSTSTTFTTNAAHGFVVGDAINYNMVTSNGSYAAMAATVTAATAFTFTVGYNNSAAGSLVSGTATLTFQRNITYSTPWNSNILRQLTFTQDQNVMTVCHPTVYPQTITYLGRQAWIFGQVSMAPKPVAPTVIVNPNSTGSQVFYWAVTTIDGSTFEESLPTIVSSSTVPSSSSVVSLIWPNVSNAVEYNVYAGTSQSTLGFRSVVYPGTQINTGFYDNGSLNIDFTSPPPMARSFFQTTPPTALPAAVGTFQQRRWYGNIGPVPETPPASIPASNYNAPAADRVIGSRIGSPTFFAIDRPVTDDGVISFRLVHRDPQTIRHFLDIGKLAIFTEQGEWVLEGGNSGITPGEINPMNVSQNGIGDLQPIQIGNLAIYRQKKGSIIRTFGFQFEIEGYRGDDLTVFSNHLVDSNQVVAWDFQKLPHPIIWMARDDGTMLGLTFIPEQNIVAWHRHDTINGAIEDVCQSDDRVYLVVRRVINGQTVRYIERLHNRNVNPINTAIYVDASISIDGTLNSLAQSAQVTGGTTWDNSDTVTINFVGTNFTASTIPAAVHLTGSDGTFVRITAITFVSATSLKGQPQSLIPASMRNVAVPTAVLAQNVITGLQHLEGQQVSVIGDGFVVSSPNNSNYPTLTVSGGKVMLPMAYGVIHVGLPITADLETLNIDTAQGQSILDKQKAIVGVSMWVENTRGLFVGAVPPEGITLNALQGLDTTITSFYEPKVRYSEGYSQPNRLLTRVIEQPLSGQWNSHGRVIIRQVDPLPAAILAIAPQGLAPIGM